MFKLHCHLCEADHLVGSRSILSMHNTSEGVIAYARCPQGHTVVVDFRDIDPYQAHKRKFRPELEAA